MLLYAAETEVKVKDVVKLNFSSIESIASKLMSESSNKMKNSMKSSLMERSKTYENDRNRKHYFRLMWRKHNSGAQLHKRPWRGPWWWKCYLKHLFLRGRKPSRRLRTQTPTFSSIHNSDDGWNFPACQELHSRLHQRSKTSRICYRCHFPEPHLP